MSLTVFVFDPKSGLQVYENLEPIADRSPEAIVWVDSFTDEAEAFTKISNTFGLHELSVEDAFTPGHFPKMEDFSSYLFLIFRSLLSKASEEEIESEDRYTRKVSLFLAPRFLVTHRRFEIPWLDAFARQVTQDPDQTIAFGTDYIAHRIVDVLVNRFERNLEHFDRKIDELELLATEDPDQFDMVAVVDMKRDLTTVHQVARAQRVIISQLATNPTPIIPKHQRRYFKDIDDQAIFVLRTLEKQLDNLRGVRDAHFAASNVRLGDTMRILAVITTLLAPLNIMVGLYGMNFDRMPMTHDPNGFWIVVGVLAVTSALLLVYFRRKKWL